MLSILKWAVGWACSCIQRVEWRRNVYSLNAQDIQMGFTLHYGSTWMRYRLVNMLRMEKQASNPNAFHLSSEKET